MVLQNVIEEISSKVAHDMAQVAKAAAGLSTLELDNRLLETMRNRLNTMESELRYISETHGKSPDIARKLALAIYQNKELIDALDSNKGKVAPRFIGALLMGMTRVLTDFTTMVLTRY